MNILIIVVVLFVQDSRVLILGWLWILTTSISIPGRSLPLIFCIHVRSGPIYWGGIYLAKKIIRWWYFINKKPKNIICDGILHVNMFHYFKIPYFTCNFFTKFTYNEYIGPYFLSHVVLRFSPSDLPGISIQVKCTSCPCSSPMNACLRNEVNLFKETYIDGLEWFLTNISSYIWPVYNSSPIFWRTNLIKSFLVIFVFLNFKLFFPPSFCAMGGQEIWRKFNMWWARIGTKSTPMRISYWRIHK